MTPHEADRRAREEAAALLGVARTASVDEIRSAHRRWALELRAGALDAEASERFRLLTEARDLLLRPPVPPPAPRPRPQPSRPPPRPPEIRWPLFVTGPAAWRGGVERVVLPDGRSGSVTVPPGVTVGMTLPMVLDVGGVATAEVADVQAHPWRRGPDSQAGRPDLGPLDLGGTIEVSLHDVVVGAAVSIEGPWGLVEVQLPAGRLLPIRLRRQGLRIGSSSGSLILELAVVMPPADDVLVRMALREHRRPPRVL